ncbi:MAG: energy transducer TonB [Methylophaga sp.]|nr:MAG: energy transducer TonB [Methylophaga sp.]
MASRTTNTDRLIFTLLFSVIIHLVIVLGISFNTTSPPTNTPLINLDITLVKQQTEQAPEQADFYAQADNEGGGETEEAMPDPTPNVVDSSSSDAPDSDSDVPFTTQTPAPITQTQPLQTIEPPTPDPIIPEIVEAPIDPVKPDPIIEEKQPPQQEKIITQQQAERKVEQTPEPDDTVKSATESVPAKPKLSAQEMMFQARNNIADLQKALDASTKALSKKPRRLKISSSTKAFAAAAYMKSWADKVERIGNTNYPQEAKKQDINGSLMLSVDIESDGSVGPNGIVISRSSGYDILDQAAVRIVRLGAPYAAIPDDVLPKGYDALTIIRTWRFETNRGLSSGR